MTTRSGRKRKCTATQSASDAAATSTVTQPASDVAVACTVTQPASDVAVAACVRDLELQDKGRESSHDLLKDGHIMDVRVHRNVSYIAVTVN